LGGEAFHKELPPDKFREVSEKNLFPLGSISEYTLEKYADGLSKYKAVFPVGPLTVLMSLDQKDKIQTYLFQQYQPELPEKDGKIAGNNPMRTALDSLVDQAAQVYLKQGPTVGLSIGVLKDGKTTFYGYGETAKGNAQLPDQNTIFEIGSISKTFTAILLADAVNSGKIKLDDPVSKYLPDSIPKLQFNNIPVTIASLSNHSSGIPRMPDNMRPDLDTDSNPYAKYDDKRLYSFYKHYTLTRKVGDDYEYSNLAVGTLGVILEKINGKPYEKLLVEKICDPLDMHDTREYIRTGDSTRFAKGYTESGKYNPPWDFKALMAAGGIRSTAKDMLKYAAANLGVAPPALKKDILLTHNITFTKNSQKVALGWHYIKPGTDEILFHNGGTGGYRSFLGINLQKNFAVVILSNCAIGVETVGGTLVKGLESRP